MSEAAWNSAPVPSEARVIANLRQSNESLRAALMDAESKINAKKYTSFKRGMFLGAAAMAVGIFAADMAYSQGFYRCEPPDRITIADDGPGRAIVTFYNSVNDCSNNIDRVMETDDGIAVRVIIKVGSAENDYRETITLEPQDPMMMAYPPEGDLLDGEERRFVIQGGLS